MSNYIYSQIVLWWDGNEKGQLMQHRPLQVNIKRHAAAAPAPPPPAVLIL